MTDQRIKLVKFVRPDCEIQRNTYGDLLIAIDGRWDRDSYISDAPDPRNDANDCEVLIRKLLTIHYEVSVNHNLVNPNVILWEVEPRDIQCCEPVETVLLGPDDDWKHGVCDLAEKIIEQQEDGDE